MNPTTLLCIGTTPAAQRVMVFRQFALDAVNRAAVTLDGPAGKSINVAKVLKALGARPVAIGFLGGARGEFIRAAMRELGIESDFVEVPAPTRQCVTVLDESSGSHTELVEESRAVDPAHFDQLLKIIAPRVADCQAMILSGTLATGGPPDFYFHCVQLAKQTGVISVVDAQGVALMEALKAKPGLVKPNRPELAATVGRELGDEAGVKQAMRDLCERGAQRVIVTDGRQPTLAFDGREFWRIAPPRIRAVNPIGSGDAFTAGLVWRLLRGDDLGEACRWGCAAGAANALTLMTGEVRRDDVDRLGPEVEVRRI